MNMKFFALMVCFSVLLLSGMAVALDSDNDGVDDSEDKCPGTTTDGPIYYLQVFMISNRWALSSQGWITVAPNGDGPKFTPTMESTSGCSCRQILRNMKEENDPKMTGQYIHGCTTGILQKWALMMAD
jgi:hypothetical protein